MAIISHPTASHTASTFLCPGGISPFTKFGNMHTCIYLVLYISQLSNQIAERVDNIFRIIHVFVDNIVSIDTRLCFCLKSYVAVERNELAIYRQPAGRRKLMKGVASESSIQYGS